MFPPLPPGTSMLFLEPAIKIEEDSMEFGKYEFQQLETNANESPDVSSQRKVQYNSKAIKGFTFPIPDEDTVERLEKTVRREWQVRRKYVSCWLKL